MISSGGEGRPDKLTKKSFLKLAKLYNGLGLSIVVDKNGKKYIFIVNADKKLEQREVKLGLRNDSDVEIVGGLNDGEMIAVDNLSRLRHGLEVNIENEKGGSI